jgi:hypothetical protein
MPIRYYLKLVGHISGWINGDSTDAEYPNWIDGPSWAIGTPTQGSFTSTGGPTKSPSLLYFVTRSGKASPRLHGAYTMGDYFELVLVSLQDGQANLRIEVTTLLWSPGPLLAGTTKVNSSTFSLSVSRALSQPRFSLPNTKQFMRSTCTSFRRRWRRRSRLVGDRALDRLGLPSAMPSCPRRQRCGGCCGARGGVTGVGRRRERHTNHFLTYFITRFGPTSAP